MRSRVGVTAVAAALSVVVSAAGHAVAAGHPVPASALPQLATLAASCFLLALSGLGLRLLLPALAAIQTALHFGLAIPVPAPVVQQHAGHLHHPVAESLPTATIQSGPGYGAAAMLGLHAGALLVSVVLLHRAQVWFERVGSALARAMPAPPATPRLQLGVPAPVAAEVRPAPDSRRWLPADVRRRGPPALTVFTVPS